MSNMYAGLRRNISDDAALRRCASRLLDMRKRMAPLRARKNDGNLLLATWNIRDFDSNKFGFGPRLAESFYYIAEIISCFDLVAIQEVDRDLGPLNKVVSILGHEWDYIVTDTTEGSGGNQERMAFLYNREKVMFRKIAGEVVLPEGQLIVSPRKVKVDGETVNTEARQQFARSPFLVAFQSGWFRFSLCTVHIYYGKESGPQLQRRIDEIKRLVEFFAARQDSVSKQEKDRRGAVENYILLGDFNVVSPEHETMKALTSEGFEVPEPIDGHNVRTEDMHFYDQIAVRVKDARFQVEGGGILNMFEDVFREEDQDTYEPYMPVKDPEEGEFAARTTKTLYKKWRSWQLSDHSPLWIEIRTDFSDSYLSAIAKE